jgi:hypothetical protein
MNKNTVFVIRPSDSKEKIYKRLRLYLQKQGFKIVKKDKNER